MSKPEPPVQKSHASGTWRAVRSMAVPANVKSLISTDSQATHRSGEREIPKIDKQSVHLKSRNLPGYFENADPSFSKS